MDLLKKLKSTGRTKENELRNLNKVRNNILAEAKKYIGDYGWNKNLLKKIVEKTKYDSNTLTTLFPEGYKSLMQLYLDEINLKMTIESKKINLIRLKVHERIRELLILRLNILSKDKKIIKKTVYHLLLPNNYKFSLVNLYKTVDQIWFLAGDNSTDFNYYSKRTILATIYTRTIMNFINNDDLNSTIKLLNRQLKQVAKIPKIKNSFKNFTKITPFLFKLRENFNFIKR
jgi:ubiquinone biosynthesis protein COQ9